MLSGPAQRTHSTLPAVRGQITVLCIQISRHCVIYCIITSCLDRASIDHGSEILGLRLANERRRNFVKASLIGWAQT